MLSLRVLLTDLVDYAGLFPPAQLPIRGAVQRYAAHRRGDHFWILGRFILPIGRLGEFERALADLAEENWRGGAWRVSVLGGRIFDGDLKAILQFNRRHAESARPVRIEAVELKVLSHEELQPGADFVSEALEVYVEVPTSVEPDVWIGAAADAGLRVKIRAGGVTPAMYTPAPDLARFLVACARRDVGFKATAGLHHALRSEHPVSDDPGSPVVLMHGFLNLFLAAAFVRTAALAAGDVEAVLEERHVSAFEFSERGVGWRGQHVSAGDLATVRRAFAVAYGSCSFESPIDDLKRIGLLTR